MSNRQLSIEEQALVLFVRGLPDEEICEELGVSPGDFLDLKRRAIKTRAAEITEDPVEIVYARYTIECARNLRLLGSLIEKMQADADPKTLTALVSAVRTRQGILDKIVEKGLDLGVLKRSMADDDLSRIAGYNLAEISTRDIRKLTIDTISQVNALLDSPNIEALEIGTLHYGPTIEEDS